jgi:hypothetical protein
VLLTQGSPKKEERDDAHMYHGQNATALVEGWRTTADTLRAFGAETQALTLEKCAEELEEALDVTAKAPLTLQEASDLGGYTVDHLGRMVREGKIPNAGRPGAPRIARDHVPIKSGHVAQRAQIRDLSRTQIVRSAIEGVS